MLEQRRLLISSFGNKRSQQMIRNSIVNTITERDTAVINEIAKKLVEESKQHNHPGSFFSFVSISIKSIETLPIIHYHTLLCLFWSLFWLVPLCYRLYVTHTYLCVEENQEHIIIENIPPYDPHAQDPEDVYRIDQSTFCLCIHLFLLE